MQSKSIVVGCGSYLPEKVVTNHDLSHQLETSHEWIVERTGIHQRHLAAEHETTSYMAFKAAQGALESAGLDPSQVDGIVVATVTPDETFPSVATMVQSRLGMRQGFAFDVSAACSGFIYGLSIADGFIQSNKAKTILVIGVDVMSKTVDWTDRASAVLFGDGAGAVVLQSQAEATHNRGILSTHIFSDGGLHDCLYMEGGPGTTRTVGYLKMQGKEVFRHAVTKLAQAAGAALMANGITGADVDWLVPHQANKRIIDATAKHLGLPTEKVILTVQNHANTSAASIPLALHHGVKTSRIQPGQLVLCEAIGAGMAWGSALIRW